MNRRKQLDSIKMIFLNLLYDQIGFVTLYRETSYKPTNRENPNNIGQTTLITTLNILEKAGYLTQIIGSKATETATSISPTEKLGEFFSSWKWLTCDINGCPDYIELIHNHDPIVLKDEGKGKGKKKKEIDYADDLKTNAMRSDMLAYESMLSKVSIEYKTFTEDGYDFDEITPPYNLRRVFNSSSFLNGGRLVAPWSSLKPEARSEIILDGDETIEIDLPSSSLNILYLHVTGSPYCGDAYDISDQGLTLKRKLIKKYLTIAQNVSSARHAKQAFSNALEKEGLLGGLIKSGVTIEQLAEAVKVKHKLVYSHLFKKGLGLRLQRAESDLVMLVIKKLMDKGIPCLTVYDSFIVKEQDKQELKEAISFVSDDCQGEYLKGLKDHYKQ